MAVADEQIAIINDDPVVTVLQPVDIPPTEQSQPSEENLDLASYSASVSQQ